ncbi:hypothetical protein TcWFU_006301 [Taenia crassiceps]|uniref:Uncharacterized protein n=1 Tax=Taenia crassiceps TaxID=6207 RepID=A0ABR4QRV3_9CEST
MSPNFQRMLEHRFTSQSPHFHNSGSAESRPNATSPVTTYRPIRPQQNARTSAPATAMATSFRERLPSPVECLSFPQGVPVEGPVRETPITPTAVSPRPPIPPKTFTLLANDKQLHCVTAPPPIPRRNFQNTFPSTSSSYSGRLNFNSPHRDTITPPPALPPRRASLRPTSRPRPSPPPHPAPVVMTSFSSIATTSTKRVSSTPDLLDGAGNGGGVVGGGESTSSGSMFASSASMRTVKSADGGGCGDGGDSGEEASVERLTLLAFRPPDVFPRSNDSSASSPSALINLPLTSTSHWV